MRRGLTTAAVLGLMLAGWPMAAAAQDAGAIQQAVNQGQRLMQMIGAAVRQLDDVGALLPVLQGLGRRQAGYGVKTGHYATVGAALLQTLAQGLGSGFSADVEAAWTEVYGVIASTMIEASAAEPVAA